MNLINKSILSGIYIHIPFCKSRCAYCDFYSTTLLNKRSEYVETLKQELKQRKDYLTDKNIKTIYFGGGTPSLLTANQISEIISVIKDLYTVETNAEITLEANPNDINSQYLQELKKVGINRLSMGVQSFDDRLLKLIGRRHSAQEAIAAVGIAQEIGFDNISIDLIYGLPTQTITDIEQDIEQAVKLNVQHISTYCLSYEKETRLTKLLEKGEIKLTDEDTLNMMYALLVKQLSENGFERYEISNFARPNYRSRHNSSYWKGTEYIGIGAAAHSYNGQTRQWNISDIENYIDGIHSSKEIFETEQLTEQDKYNEQVMLSLRTAEGIDLSQLSNQNREYCFNQATKFIKQKLIISRDEHLIATDAGINILNYITEHLMQ